MTNKRPIDRTKKSNIKCEHCEFYNRNEDGCTNKTSPKYNSKINYWNRCKRFEWREGEKNAKGRSN